MKNLIKLMLTCSLGILIINNCQNYQTPADQDNENNVFISPLGKRLTLPDPSQKMLDQLEKAKQDYINQPDNPESHIWFGRRTAYLGKYEDAIQIYTTGIGKFPEDPRLYRHRGHRYISIRKFDEAIRDLEKATQLIEGTENEIEPDGMPNALNIPISTLHGNIWYHLGLAYYLKHDYEKAFEAYSKCREAGKNYDNIVSSTHWLYMIQRRMGNTQLAEQLLEPVHPDSTVIENHSYNQLCQFYKGILPLDSLNNNEEGPASDAIRYGIANWYFYNGDKEQSRRMMGTLLESRSWSSFGYIAAESDWLKYFAD